MNDRSTASDPASAPPSVGVLLGIGLLTIVLAGGYFCWRMSVRHDSDSRFYRAIAEGRIAEVQQPFTNRVLHVWLARHVSEWTGCSLETSFLAVAVGCFATLVGAGLWLLRGWTNSAWLIAAIIITPMALTLFREIYLPDCLHAALLVVFFLLLNSERWWLAAVALFLLQLARESTILVTASLVLVAAYQRRWKLAGGAILVTLLAMAITGHVANQGRPNIHGANTLVYMVAKVPFNFLTNVCGIRMWTDTQAANNPKAYPNAPLVSMPVPGWVPAGAIHAIGIYSISPEYPLLTARVLLTVLGVMPSLVIATLLWRRWRLVSEDGLSLTVLVATLYGLISFLLGPSLGASLGRLVAYGWPLAWIVAPAFLDRYYRADEPYLQRLAGLQAIACWTPMLTAEFGLTSELHSLISIAVAVPCHWAALRMSRARRIDPS